MILQFDGAMGTMLQASGLPAGECPERYNLEEPDKISKIHQLYLNHGADIIETNTFGACRIKLDHYGLGDQTEAINLKAAAIARSCAGTKAKVAGSVGPTGKLIYPLGELTFDEAYDAFYEQICALDKGGVDLILIETIIDIQEMRAALLSAKDATKKPVFCQLTFQEDGRTVTGTDPETAAVILEALGADVLGVNCSLGPAQLIPIVKTLAAATSLPLSVQPNAGMPELIQGETVFPMSPSDMAAYIPELIEAGASYIGGCCGTTPDHIRAMKEATLAYLAEKTPPARPAKKRTAVITSRSKCVYIGPDLPPAIIGERINPTGRKTLQQDIKDGKFMLVKKEALAQARAGAAILDVNMGVPAIDQAVAMKEAIDQLAMLTDLPLSIDTTDVKALEAALKAYPGRALVNSVSAEPERIAEFLPLAKRYGAAILCLPIESGVPKTADERLALIDKIAEAAYAHGFKEEDLFLDALVLTVAAEPTAPTELFKTLKLYQEKYPLSPITGGLSNISFGLPNRDLLNSTFTSMVLALGLKAPILNPYNPFMKDVLAAIAVFQGHDASGQKFSLNYAQTKTILQTETTKAPAGTNEKPSEPKNILATIKQAVKDGEKEHIVSLVEQALQEGYKPLEITDHGLTEAMNEIGDDFGAGRCFLPQVMMSAETMRQAFLTIKKLIPAQAVRSEGTVVLATVKGDIHDLGKNIVAALLENNGFTVIDLGKDVPPESVAQAAKENKAHLVGLCALMTTTMPQIDKTIAVLKDQQIAVNVLVGGAVLTQDYADLAGANGYAPNGVAAVHYTKNVMAELKKGQ